MTSIGGSVNRRDLRLFGGPVSDLSHWMKAAAWSLEEAVAISLGYEPDVLSLPKIQMLCPEEIRDRHLRRRPEVLNRLSPLAQSFLGRLFLLQRAVEIDDDLHSKRIDGGYLIRPHDFLRWFDAQTAEDWKEHIRVAMQGLLKAWRASSADTGEKKANHRDFGSLEDKKGVAKTWECIVSELNKPESGRRAMIYLKRDCVREHGITDRDFEALREKARNDPSLPKSKKGRPPKHK